MERLTIVEENYGAVEVIDELTPDMVRYSIEDTHAVVLRGKMFKGLLTEFRGDWFSAWYSRYWIKAPTVLRSTGDLPLLELRISWRNTIKGTWEKIKDAELKMQFFTISFATHINTRSVFEQQDLYETFDIHVDVRVLYEFGVDYKILRDFIERVIHKEPGNIGDHPYACPKTMVDAIFSIFNCDYTGYGRKLFLECKMKEILIAALIAIGTPENILPKLLKPYDREKLEEAKHIIAMSVPKYPGNKSICRMAGLNETKLNVGFKHYFKQTPYDYFLELKMQKAKELILRGGQTIKSVADELEYEWANTFIREFRKHFGYTPLQFAKYSGMRLPTR